MTEGNEQVPEALAEHNAPPASTEHEDTIAVTQDVIQGLLSMLAEAWAELAELKAESARQQQEISRLQLTGSRKTVQSSGRLEGAQDLTGVLIVDDSQILRLRLKSLVESLGFEVVGMAEDGVQGANLAISLQPKLIILDQMMPGMSGLDCMMSIRKAGISSHVIICSAAITAALSAEFAAAGATLVLTKPIQLDAFVKAVKAIMSDQPVEEK